MNGVQEVIIYRSPLDKMSWDIAQGAGGFVNLTPILCGIVVAILVNVMMNRLFTSRTIGHVLRDKFSMAKWNLFSLGLSIIAGISLTWKMWI